MLNITINGETHQVADGTRVLAACRAAGVDIPTLCWLEGQAHFTSCMVCAVKDVERGRLIPACSAPVADGMVIETDTDEVSEARRVALELLLSEHVGDCRAPCQRVCPAQIDIPGMLRQIEAGDMTAAARTVQQARERTGITCESCKAPCEKACRRGRADQALAIRNLVTMVEKVEIGDRRKTEDGRLQTVRQPTANSREMHRFDSTIGPLQPGDLSAFMAGAAPGPQVIPDGDDYTAAEASREAARCLRCDCRKPAACKLRDLADAYGARQARYKGTGRKPVEIIRDHPAIVFEPGKCIKCGICTRLAEAAGETPGLTFLQRGMETTVGVPFGDPLAQALTPATARRCADACPTGALSRPQGESSIIPNL